MMIVRVWGNAMRLGGAIIFAAVLAIAGCKSTDSKAPDKKDKEPQASAAERTRGQTPAWLEDSMAKLPGAGTNIPKAGSWTNPKDPSFNPTAESRGLLAGKVFDPYGRGAKGVFIRIEAVDNTSRDQGAPIGILTDSEGFFMAKDLPQGRTYNLTAEARSEGKQLYGVVQTRPPNSNIAITLRDDLIAPLPAASDAASPTLPPPSSALIPSTGIAPAPPAMRSREGEWAPGAGAASSPVPATIGTGSPPAGLPSAGSPAPNLPAPPRDPRPATTRPENVADSPGFRPPTANIPGPGVPQFPSLPPSMPALPPSNQPEKRSYRSNSTPLNFALVDTLGRPWEFASNRSGSLILLDFMTTTCVPCKRAIPTLIDLQARYAAEGLQVVGVVCDELPESTRIKLADKYQQENRLNYLLYVEPGAEPGSVRDRFRVEEYPTVILLDSSGNILWRGHPGNKTVLENAIRQQLKK